ncbi:MAG: DnaJ C-terminal domain-containing protein [candidate division Zixibacteria bacterium]|nr:DnaJ C-terminal domain-containing protein [candidate division Zixibacteria bacterium]
MTTDFYKVLGVSENATADEIKKQFRKLAKKHHPDRNKGAKQSEAKFKELSEAYETLSDDTKRKEYDMMRRYGAHEDSGGRQPGQGFDYSRTNTTRGGRSTANVDGFEGFDNVDDILSSLFGGRSRTGFEESARRRQSRAKGADSSATISVTFTEAALGAKKYIQIMGGRKLAVNIPTGIEDGSKIRLAGQGAPDIFGGEHGDLIITVQIMPDPLFDRKGNDIYTHTEISLKEALLGTKKNIKTLTNTVTLNIPSGTQPGAQLRLKGQGLTVGGAQGDLYVEIRVSLPRTLSEKQKKMLEEWEE